MRVDGDVRNSAHAKVSKGASPLPSGYIAGSKALESLDRLITSIESFFHPSNFGKWTLSVGLKSYKHTDSTKVSNIVNHFFTAFGC
jgi:proteasome activator subunit 4